MLYTYFCVIPRRLNITCRGLGRILSVPSRRPMKMEHTECSETSAHKIQKPGNRPKVKKNTTLRTRQKFEIKNALHVPKY